MNKYYQIYQSSKHSFYYSLIPDLFNQGTKILNAYFDLSTNNQDYVRLYEDINEFIENNITLHDIQITNQIGGISESIITAFLLFKGFELSIALEVQDEMKINKPQQQYMKSLIAYEQKLKNNTETHRMCSIISINNDQRNQQSEFLNQSIFSTRLIDSQTYPTILDSDDQIESEIIINPNMVSSIITFRPNNDINQEESINSLHTTLRRIQK